MRPVLAAISALLLLPGCLGGGEDAEPPGQTPPGTCPPEADCVARPGAAAQPPDASPVAPADAARTVSVPFSYEGSTGTAICPPALRAGFAHCVSLQAGDGAAPEMQVPTPLRLAATLTGDARPGGQPFYVSLLVDVGEGWTWDPAREPSAEGEPPLAVDWDLSAYPRDAKFMFYVESAQAVGPVTFVVDRAYAVEGELSGLAPA